MSGDSMWRYRIDEYLFHKNKNHYVSYDDSVQNETYAFFILEK